MSTTDSTPYSVLPDHAGDTSRRRALARIFWWATAILAAITIYTVSMTPGSDLPNYRILAYDKMLHAVSYFVLTGLWCLAISRQWPAWPALRVATCAGIFCILHGIFGELMQGYIPGRFSSVADAVANTVGAAVASWIWIGYARMRTST